MSVPGPFARGWAVSVMENGIYQEQLSIFFGVRDVTRPEIPWCDAGSTPRDSNGVKVQTSDTGTDYTQHDFNENARLKSLEMDRLARTSFNRNVMTRLDKLERTLAASRQTSDSSERRHQNELAVLQTRIGELEIHRRLDSTKTRSLSDHNAAENDNSIARMHAVIERMKRSRLRTGRRHFVRGDASTDSGCDDDVGRQAPPRSKTTVGNYEAAMSAVASPYIIR